MTRQFLIIAAATLIAASASAQTVEVDWDRDADFASYKTFAWSESKETSVQAENPLAAFEYSVAPQFSALKLQIPLLASLAANLLFLLLSLGL